MGSMTGESNPLPPSIMPIVILKGSDHEMGYQYGQQAGRFIERQKNGVWVASIEELGSREKVVQQLKGMEHYVKKYTPEAIEQMKAMVEGAAAEGCKVSYTDILLINCGAKRIASHIERPSGSNTDDLSPTECSVFAAWGSATRDGKFVFGDSKDSDFDYMVVLVVFPDQGNAYMAGVRAGELSEHFAFNNRGLFVGTGQNAGRREEDYGYGLKKQFGIQHILRFAESGTEAKDMFLSWEFPNTTNLIFADVEGQAFVVERTASVKGVRKPGDFGERDFIYSTNNSMTKDMKEAVKSETFIEHAGWSIKGGSIPRSLEVWNMFNNYHGKIDMEFVKMMWRFTGEPSPYDRKGFEEDRDQMICNFQNIRVAVGRPDKGEKGFAYICTGPAGRLLNPPSLRRRPCFQIEGTHSFYRLVLASGPAKLVRESREDAFDNLAEAYREMMILDYGDGRYILVKNLYSQAVSEYYEGINLSNIALLENGDESIRYFARAATAFTRSQAHSRQVYDILVPPPSRPQDLGLQPYGGSWAQWVKR